MRSKKKIGRRKQALSASRRAANLHPASFSQYENGGLFGASRVESLQATLSPPHAPVKLIPGLPGSRSIDVNPFILPTRTQVLSLVSRYFQYCNPLFPYLHEPSFMTTYKDAVDMNFVGVRRTWPSLLNIVMAMGMETTIDTTLAVKEKHGKAEVFFARAWELSKDSFFKASTTEAGKSICLSPLN